MQTQPTPYQQDPATQQDSTAYQQGFESRQGEPTPYQQGPSPAGPKKSRKRLFIILGIVAALVCALAIYLVVTAVIPAAEENQQKEEITAVDQSIDNVIASYTNAEGYVDKSNVKAAVSAVEQYAQANPDGLVESYVSEGDRITLVLTNGIHYVYMPTVPGVLNAGDNIETTITIEPYQSAFEGANHNGEPFDPAIDQDGKELAEAWGCESEDGSTYDNVTAQEMKTLFGSSQMVLLYGHGFYTSVDGSMIGTGTEVIDLGAFEIGSAIVGIFYPIAGMITGDAIDAAAEISERTYGEDLKEHRLVVQKASVGGSRLCVTSKFFDYYYDEGSLENSVIYFGTCDAMKDVVNPVPNYQALSGVLLSCGASYVGGYTATNPIDYELDVRAKLIEELSKDKTTLDTAFFNTKRYADEQGGDALEEDYHNTYFTYVPLAEGLEHQPTSKDAPTEVVVPEPEIVENEDGSTEEVAPVLTWYSGAWTNDPEGSNIPNYITSVTFDGDTLVIKGAMMHATSEEALKALNPYSDPSVVDKPQTYRFKLTDDTVITQVTSSAEGTTKNMTKDQFKDLTMPYAPGNTYCVDEDGNLISIWLGA